MIVALPLDENKTDLCVSFGRAPYFMLKDTENGNSEIIPNAAADEEGGAGVKAAQIIADSRAEALITIRCGENAAKVLKAAKVSIYKAQGIDLEQNTAAVKNGQLDLLTHFHPGFHGGQ